MGGPVGRLQRLLRPLGAHGPRPGDHGHDLAAILRYGRAGARPGGRAGRPARRPHPHYLFHRTTTAHEPVCYLNDLFTSPEARGQGVGRALIEAVYDAARRAGSTRVYWQTHETNATARTLYDKVAERSGFLVYAKRL